jgi:hypothetical protein
VKIPTKLQMSTLLNVKHKVDVTKFTFTDREFLCML